MSTDGERPFDWSGLWNFLIGLIQQFSERCNAEQMTVEGMRPFRRRLLAMKGLRQQGFHGRELRHARAQVLAEWDSYDEGDVSELIEGALDEAA